MVMHSTSTVTLCQVCSVAYNLHTVTFSSGLLTSFPGLPTVQFLIALCKNREGRYMYIDVSDYLDTDVIQVIKWTRSCPSIFGYCKRSEAGRWECPENEATDCPLLFSVTALHSVLLILNMPFVPMNLNTLEVDNCP